MWAFGVGRLRGLQEGMGPLGGALSDVGGRWGQTLGDLVRRGAAFGFYVACKGARKRLKVPK